jgi:hypothetical protein
MLATLDDLKTYCGIKPDATDADALLTRLLEAVSKQVEGYCSRSFVFGERTEQRSGTGSDVLLLRDLNVTAVSSLSIDGRVIPAAVGATGSGFVFDDSTIYLRGYIFSRGRKNITVTYTAGFNPLPADLSQAVIEVAAQAFKEKEWTGYLSKSLAGETVTFARLAFPDSAKVSFDEYLRVYPCD